MLNYSTVDPAFTDVVFCESVPSAFLADLKRLETDPEKFQQELRKKGGYFERAASDLFATVVYLCDGFFVTRRPQAAKGSVPGIQRYLASPGQMGAVRFFGVVSRLPLELQMIISNRVYGLSRDSVPGEERETSFRQLVWSM